MELKVVGGKSISITRWRVAASLTADRLRG